MPEGLLTDLGPANLTHGSQDLGPTFGGSKFFYSNDSVPILEDASGTTDVGRIYTGQNCRAECMLTRTQIAALSSAIPGASHSYTSGNQLIVRNTVGTNMYNIAQIFTMKPIIEGVASVDINNWLTIFMATAEADLEVAYDMETQRVYKTVFRGFKVDANDDGATGTLAGWLWGMGWQSHPDAP